MKKERIKAEDYQNKDRPSTRLKQYGDIFKHRFVELLKVSLLQAVFNMPLIATLILFYSLIRNSENVNQVPYIYMLLNMFVINRVL